MENNYKVFEDIYGQVEIRFNQKITIKLPNGSIKMFKKIFYFKKNPTSVSFQEEDGKSFYIKLKSLKDIEFAKPKDREIVIQALQNQRANNKTLFKKSVKDYLVLKKGKKNELQSSKR